MRWGVFALLTAAQLPLATTVLAQGASFDCATATKTIERAICQDPDLARLDGQMGQLFRTLLTSGGDRKIALEGQRRWIAQRNNACGTGQPEKLYECIQTYENSRIAALTFAVRTASAAPVAPTPAPTQSASAAPPPAPSVGRPAPAPTPVQTLPRDYDGRVFGNWMTAGTADRFGDGGAYVAATGDGNVALAVRCIQKDLSIAIRQNGGDPKPISKGQSFALKFRIDMQPVVETMGLAIDDRLIQVLTEKSLVKAIRDGRETALRVETGGTISTHVFKNAGAQAAFADLLHDCPVD